MNFNSTIFANYQYTSWIDDWNFFDFSGEIRVGVVSSRIFVVEDKVDDVIIVDSDVSISTFGKG